MALAQLYRTPEDYLAAAISQVEASQSKLTDFTTGSVTRTLFEALTVALSDHSRVVDQLRLDSYLATATGEALDAKAADQGVFRVPAVPATGTIRITRQSTTEAVSIPAGWGELSTIPSPGAPAVPYVTTEDAVFAPGVGEVDVAAAAAIPGTVGNLSQATGQLSVLLPVNPVAGFRTDGDFFAVGPFRGGVDSESDAALRARVPLEVAGRVKGRKEAFLAATLRVPKVASAAVVRPGESNGVATVPANNVEVYFEGDADALPTVVAEVERASMLGQNVAVAAAAPERVIVTLTVYTRPGVDPVALRAAVKAAVTGVVEAGGCGGIVRYSAAIEAVHALSEVISVSIPFAQFRKASTAAGTAGDIVLTPRTYASMAQSDITVNVETIG